MRDNARDAQGVIDELVWHLVAASSPRPKEPAFRWVTVPTAFPRRIGTKTLSQNEDEWKISYKTDEVSCGWSELPRMIEQGRLAQRYAPRHRRNTKLLILCKLITFARYLRCLDAHEYGIYTIRYIRELTK